MGFVGNRLSLNADVPLTMNDLPTRLLIVDDHFMVRLGLIGAISGEQDLEVCGEAASGAEAIQLYQRLRPDVVLMDGILPDMHGVEVTRHLVQIDPNARVLVVSINDTAADVQAALSAGAMGYMPKSCDKSAIVAAIREVALGNRYLSEELQYKLTESGSKPILSAKEIEVLKLVAQGFANKQVAAQLCISETTVKTHVHHILEKLGVPDRTRAVTLAMERGMLRW